MGKVRTYVQLSKEERVRIEVLLGQGLSQAAIAEELGRSAATISRELRRNSTSRYRTPVYNAAKAEARCRTRHQQKAKAVLFSDAHKDFIARMLEGKYSPELISVQGKARFGRFVSAEWIYQWIWQMKCSQKAADKSLQGLFKHLRHASRKRRRGNKKHQRGNIIGRRFIQERPRVANERSEVGHLEGDIVLGRDRQPGLLVVIDRKTRLARLRKLPTKDAAFVTLKLKDICRSAGARTLTLDNDQSFAHHYRIGVDTYFTNPYSSQEKGSVENRIGLIRMYFPKKTDFTKVTAADVRKVENAINNRPMRMFGYRTPRQMHKST